MIDDMPLWHSKSYADAELMMMFRENDKKLFNRSLSMRSKLVWGNLSDDDQEEAFHYECNILQIKERLRLSGISFAKVKRKFDLMKHEFIEDQYSLLIQYPEFKDRVDKLNKISFKDYCTYLKIFYENRYNLNSLENPLFCLLNNEISYEKNEIFTFNYDIREIIIIYAEILSGKEMIIQDLTEVTNAGYYHRENNVIEDCENLLINTTKAAQSIYIFTEGTNDQFALKESLKILYPHLYDYFEFVNYDICKMGGGAHILTTLIKAFLGTRMLNKIIAIYDSDTAAYESIRLIEGLSMPKNIKYTTYPDYPLLNSYPSIDENNQICNKNIYSLGASIELYLGIDCLKDDNNNLFLAKWKSYNEKLKRYQVEIQNKSKINSNFREKIKKIQQYGDKSDSDFSGLKLIWEHIFELVHDMS
jgi:hypothetical protein